MRYEFVLDKELNICEDAVRVYGKGLCRVDFAADCSDKNFKYIFYGREFVMSDENCNFSCEYGYMYPFSMAAFLCGENGVTFIAQAPVLKGVELIKKGDICTLGMIFDCRECAEINILIKRHKASLIQSIEAYKLWYRSRFGELPKSRSEAAEVYHIKRYFLHKKFCPDCIVDADSIRIDDMLKNDSEQIGGVDCALMFDLDYNEETDIRCGNINVYEYDKAVADKLRIETEKAAKKYNCIFFSYFDPYLIERGSQMGREHPGIIMLNEQGDPHFIWDESQYTPCLENDLWRKYSKEHIIQLMKAIGSRGVYLDEFGNSTQHRCYNKEHKHSMDYSQIESEIGYADYLKSDINALWMCEFPPCDNEDIGFDIVLSDTKTLVNIYRFIFPKLKFVRIVGCDYPLGDNVWELNKSFFNGEGFWFDNDINNPAWYSERLKSAAKEQYFILKKYSDCFTSENVHPLILKDDKLLVNEFICKNKAVLTMINPTDSEIHMQKEFDRAELVENLYSHSQVTSDKKGVFTIKIPPKEVACIFIRIGES